MQGPAGFDPIAGIMRTELKPGAGIDMTGGTISVITPPEGVPYVAGDGIAINGATVMADLDAGAGIAVNGSTITADVAAVGFGMELAGGTASYARYRNIETVSGSSVTLQAGHAYKIYATAAAVTLHTETIPSGQYGQEGHLEIFVAGTGYVVTGSNVVLANALEPDAVNNITARFHDGLCILSVEDHVAGYIVTVNAASGAGSLAYGLATATNEYISVDASLNGQTLDLGGVTTSAGEKHVVGNGYTETIVSGGINCTSKTTLSNLAANGVIVSSGTLTLGDVYIPSGATVAVSGGGLAIEKVSGNGGVIDLGGKNYAAAYSTANVSGCVVTGGAASSGFVQGGAFYIASNGVVNLSGATVTGNFATNNGGGVALVTATSILNCTNSYIKGNSALYGAGKDIWIFKDATANVSNCQLGIACVDSGSLSLSGSNTIDLVTTLTSGFVTLTSGAIVDLTGNTNATPIAPGGGITFESGGATLLYGSAESPTTAYVGGGITGAIGSGGKLIGGISKISLNSDNTWSASNVTLTGGTGHTAAGTTYGGALFIDDGASITLTNVVITGNTAAITNGIHFYDCQSATFDGCTFDANQGCYFNGINGNLTIKNRLTLHTSVGLQCYTASACKFIIESGTIIDTQGNNVYAALVCNNGIEVQGGCQVITSAGASVSIEGGTYTKINNDGTTE